jgi:hypothetical protein
MDAYTPPGLRKVIDANNRPAIVKSPATFKYGNSLNITINGGYASRCSLSKPAATTHTSGGSHRMLLLKTEKNGMDSKVVTRGGYLVVAAPKSVYVAPPGWWVLYCWHADVWTVGRWIYLADKSNAQKPSNPHGQ